MNHRLLLPAAAGALMIAVPASAQQAPRQNAEAGSVNMMQPSETDARKRRICVKQVTLGSRIYRRTCRTQWQWEQDGGVPGQDD